MEGLLGDTQPTLLPWTAVTRARHAYDSVEVLAPDGFCIARLVFGGRIETRIVPRAEAVANGLRVLACVDACAGIDDPADLRRQLDALRGSPHT